MVKEAADHAGGRGECRDGSGRGKQRQDHARPLRTPGDVRFYYKYRGKPQFLSRTSPF